MQAINQQQEPVTSDDIKLWKQDKVTKRMFKVLNELTEKANQFLQSETNLYKPNAEKLYAHTYGSLRVIRILQDAEFEDKIVEELKEDERY